MGNSKSSVCQMMILLLTAAVFGYPNDPLYPKQEPYLEAIGLQDAWAEAQRGHARTRTTIAVIDSGMMSDHPDLKDNYTPGYNVANGNKNTSDVLGHGTQVSGVAGAVVNNGAGIAGIADFVDLMPIKIGDRAGDVRSSYIRKGLLYAVKKDVDAIVIAYTQGGEMPLGILEGIEAANNANIPVICIAGNHGENISEEGNQLYPCDFTKVIDGVICVAGTRKDTMNLYKNSNYAPFVDIAAPADGLATTRNGGYTRVTGTSFSGAIVAGAVAFIKSVSPRTLTVKEIKSILKETSTPGVKSFDGKTTMTFGRLNVYEAMKRVIN